MTTPIHASLYKRKYLTSEKYARLTCIDQSIHIFDTILDECPMKKYDNYYVARFLYGTQKKNLICLPTDAPESHRYRADAVCVEAYYYPDTNEVEINLTYSSFIWKGKINCVKGILKPNYGKFDKERTVLYTNHQKLCSLDYIKAIIVNVDSMTMTFYIKRWFIPGECDDAFNPYDFGACFGVNRIVDTRFVKGNAPICYPDEDCHRHLCIPRVSKELPYAISGNCISCNCY